MFYGAAASNQAIPAGGDTSDTAKVTDTAGLFNGASAFNKDISSWAVGSVTAHQQLQHVCQISLCMFELKKLATTHSPPLPGPYFD